MKALFGACESSASHLGAVASLSPAGTSLENLQPSISTPPPPLGQADPAPQMNRKKLQSPLFCQEHCFHKCLLPDLVKSSGSSGFDFSLGHSEKRCACDIWKQGWTLPF